MAAGNYYLMRCQNGANRYWRAYRWKGFACTHEELPREVCNSARVNLCDVVSFTLEKTGELARIKGNEWEDSGKMIPGNPA